MMRLSDRQYNTILFLVSLAGFLLTLNFFGLPIEPGLDASWKYAQNRFFAEGMRLGRDVIGTYGPLGFLLNPMPLGSNLRLAFWFEVVIRISLVLVSVRLFLGQRRERVSQTLLPAVLLALMLFTVNRGEKTPGLELVALAACLVSLASHEDRPAFLSAATVVTALALLIKFSIGVLCLSFPVVYGLWVLTRRRDVLRPGIWIFGPFLLAAAIWLALYGSFQGMGDYLVGSLEQSRGYSSAMTSLGAVNAPGWIIAALATLAFLLASLRKERDLFLLLLLFTPGLLVAVKYGVTKQPQFLFSYAFLMLFVLAGRAKTLLRQVSIVAAMSLSIFFLNFAAGFLGADAFRFDAAEPLLKPVHLRATATQFFDFKGYEKGLRARSDALLRPMHLSDRSLTKIGSGTVDTYPWEISFIPANTLNWRPRPVFQSYFAYTPWLDHRNETFFRSGKAPAFILWDSDRADHLFSVDGRYLLNDEPLTILQILGHYAPVALDGEALIFSRRDRSSLRPSEPFATTDAVPWNSWFEVPDRRGGIVRARLQCTRTLLGRLRRTFYKDSPVFIDYLYASGVAARFRLVLDNAESGIWTTPFVTSLVRPRSAQRTVALRIVNPDAEQGSFSPTFAVAWEFIAFDGPPAPYLVE